MPILAWRKRWRTRHIQVTSDLESVNQSLSKVHRFIFKVHFQKNRIHTRRQTSKQFSCVSSPPPPSISPATNQVRARAHMLCGAPWSAVCVRTCPPTPSTPCHYPQSGPTMQRGIVLTASTLSPPVCADISHSTAAMCAVCRASGSAKKTPLLPTSESTGGAV